MFLTQINILPIFKRLSSLMKRQYEIHFKYENKHDFFFYMFKNNYINLNKKKYLNFSAMKSDLKYSFLFPQVYNGFWIPFNNFFRIDEANPSIFSTAVCVSLYVRGSCLYIYVH